MRRTFAQVLQEGKIDIKEEYLQLYDMFYGTENERVYCLYEIISDNFLRIPFRGTSLSFRQFNHMHKISFEKHPWNFDVEYLVSFCEYIFNFLVHMDTVDFDQYPTEYDLTQRLYIQHIRCVIEKIGYMEVSEKGVFIFVPKDTVAISVAEMDMIPAPVSYKVISYCHHSMKGDLDRKKQTLLTFAELLEPKRKELESADSKLATDLFYALNNFNIRHNNIDPSSPKYKKPVGDLDSEQLEEWYDEAYQMCLLACMRLEHISRKDKFDKLKERIENKK